MLNKIIVRGTTGIIVENPDAVASSIVSFFSRPPTQVVQESVFQRDGEMTTTDRVIENPMPTIEEWCVQNRVTSSLLKQAALAHEVIAEAVEFARDVMKMYLIQKGLSGAYDARIVTLVASNETDMKIKTESNVKLSHPNSILEEILDGEANIVDAKILPAKPKKQLARANTEERDD